MSVLSLVKFYHRYEDSLGRTWFVPYDTKFPGDDVWVHNPLNQAGSGGAVRSFVLSPGATIAVKGPWPSTPEELYKHTGVDVRNRCAIKLSAHRLSDGLIMYQDHQFVCSSVEATRACAQHLANLYSCKIVAKITTHGGFIDFIINPEEKPTGGDAA